MNYEIWNEDGIEEASYLRLEKGSHGPSLKVFSRDQSRKSLIVSLSEDGRLVRNPNINPDFGLDLDNEGRIVISDSF